MVRHGTFNGVATIFSFFFCTAKKTCCVEAWEIGLKTPGNFMMVQLGSFCGIVATEIYGGATRKNM